MFNKNRVDFWNKQRIGLVLAGGGGKGAFEAGAFQALYDLDYASKIRVVSGTSVGALNTLLFAMESRDLCRKVWEEVNFKAILTPAKSGAIPEAANLIRSLVEKNFQFGELPDLIRNIRDGNDCPLTQDGIWKIISENVDVSNVHKSNRDFYVCAYDIAASRPQYFLLNRLPDDEVVKAVLASSAIPVIFPPVVIRGKKYADGGCNMPDYAAKNADNIPVLPLARYNLDRVIVIHLDPDDKSDYRATLGNTPVINVFPSKPLESFKGAGTLNFSQSAVKSHFAQGYYDTMAELGSYMVNFLSLLR
ncbi:MAG: patatin-like phospholipase family protein [Oscillospiraceae bacterium]|nr:patatin-like phospholipase family protein [Oscillospiraceae bacterium]